MLKRKIPTPILIFFIADILLGVIYLLIYKFGDPLPRHVLTKLFDLDGEANIPAWYSSMQLFGVAILFGVFAYCNFNKSNFRSWLLVIFPLIFLLLSADEVGQIHERLGQISDVLLSNGSRSGSLFKNTGIWMFILGIPFTVVFIFLLNSIKSYFSKTKGVLFKLILGMIIMLSGALLIESLSNFWDMGTKRYVIEVYFEETFEMIGVTIMLWAAYDLLKKHNFKLSLNPLKEKQKEIKD